MFLQNLLAILGVTMLINTVTSAEVTIIPGWSVVSPGGIERRVRNSHQCTRLCQYSATCESVSFDVTSGLCRLHFAKPEVTSANLLPDADSLFAIITHQNSSCSACSCSPCPQGQHCVPTEQGNHSICLDAGNACRCPCSPPALLHSDVHVTGTSLQATGTYTCRENFMFFGTSSQVTCDNTFTWVGLSGSCLRTSWTDVVVNDTNPWQRTIPASPNTGWTLEVIASTPLTVRSEINIMAGLDVVMNFSSAASNGIVFLNHRLNGALGARLGPLGPVAAGKTFNVTMATDSANSAIEVFLDGNLLVPYPCIDTKACSARDRVRLSGDLTATSVRLLYPQ